MRYRNKNQIAYETLRDAIIKGDYKPGERLVIDNIAKELEVSHSPIRECMRQLETDGFVSIQPNSGATVTDLDINIISEVFTILESLEVMSSRLASVHITDDQLAELKALVEEMGNEQSDTEVWSQKNMDFHMKICEASGTTLIKGMMRQALYHWQRFQYHYLYDVLASRLEIAQADHVQLVKALKEGNPDKVEVIVREHNRKAFTSYASYLEKKYDDYIPISIDNTKDDVS